MNSCGLKGLSPWLVVRFLVITNTFIIVAVRGQFAESPCLLNRVDHVPCEFSDSATPRPAANQYGIYTTRILNGPTCEILDANHQIKTINTLGGSLVKLIFSPGIELFNREDYSNQQYVKYRISCPSDRNIAYFRIATLNLEPQNCPIPGTPDNECRDYIQIPRHGGAAGVFEICGNTLNGNNRRGQLDEGNFDVIFRTSDTGRYPGFQMIVNCIRGFSRRGKRDLEEFTNTWKRRLEILKIMKAKKIGRFRRQDVLRFEEITVPFGATLSYENRVVTVVDSRNNELQRVTDIRWLHTFGEEGVTNEYRGTAADMDGRPLEFPGAGSLVIVGDHAYFTLFLIDPRGILPANEMEVQIVDDFSTAIFDLLDLEQPEERLCDELLNPPPIDIDGVLSGTATIPPPQSSQCPQPNVTDTFFCNFNDSTLLLALNNTESSNEVINTIADEIISCTERDQPGRIEELLATTQLPTSVTTTMTQAPVGLMVNCIARAIGINNIEVQCSSNRVGQADLGISIINCLLDQGNFVITLADFCQYPTFTFPLIEPGIPPGNQNLTLLFQDADEFSAVARVPFIAPFSVTCNLTASVGTLVIVACASNQLRTAIQLSSCVVDSQMTVQFCAYPMFTFDAAQFGVGTHTLDIQFEDTTSGALASMRINLSVGG